MDFGTQLPQSEQRSPGESGLYLFHILCMNTFVKYFILCYHDKVQKCFDVMLQSLFQSHNESGK